jgi:hypothetical protein
MTCVNQQQPVTACYESHVDAVCDEDGFQEQDTAGMLLL